MIATIHKFQSFLKHNIRSEHIILAGILVLNIVLRLMFLHEPFERDEGTYSMLGQEILRGAIPYRDAIEIKPPGLMYIYAAMIGLFGIETTEGIRIATAVYVQGTLLSVYWLGRYLFGVRAGLVSAFLYAVYSTTPLLQGSSSNGENFLVLPIMLSACLLVKWLDSGKRQLLVLCGLLSWIALIIKPVALPHVGLLVLVIAWHEIRRPSSGGFDGKSLRKALLSVACFCLPVLTLYLVGTLYLYLHGALGDAVYWNFTFLKLYSSAPQEVAYTRFRHTFDNISQEHVVLWLAGIPAFIWLLSRRDLKSTFLASMLPAALVGICLPRHFYAHYFIQMIPPLALIAGCGIAMLWQERRRLFFCVTPLMLVAVFYSCLVDYDLYFNTTPEQVCIIKYQNYGIDFVDSVKVSNYIRERSKPGDYVFQWGLEPQIYFLTGLRSPSPYCSDQAALWAQNPQEAFQDVMNSLLRLKPRFIVVQERANDNPATPVVLDFLANYYAVDTIVGNFVIFRLR